MAPCWVVCGHPCPDRGINPCCIPQGQQQIFLEVLAERSGNFSSVPRFKIPILVQTQLERGIVSGRNKKVQLPIVDICGGSLLQPETEGKTGLCVRFGEVRAPGQPVFVILQLLSRRGLIQNRSVRIDTPIQERASDLLVELPCKGCSGDNVVQEAL